jgi:molybdopterin molybdotransferase
MLTVSEVWQKIDSLTGPLPAEPVPLAHAAGRVLREVVNAPEDQPAFDRSAIDGYVVPLSASAGATLRVVGGIPMGQLAPAAPAPGTALKLFTGSALPAGELGLVMWEDAALAGDTITLRVAPSASFIRRRASQARAGDTLLSAGIALNPGALALLASVGIISPSVSRRPRAAHLVTGGELLAPDAAPVPGRIRDSNSTLIAALLAASSASLVAHARAGETYAEHTAAFATLLAAEPDVILVSGGSSGGEHDHAARLFGDHGFSLVVNQVASRPGKPLLIATRGAQVAIGLPGNPLSHFVCYHLFVARLLARLTGAAPASVVNLSLAPGAPLRANPRETWWPATRTGEGYAPLPWADSSDLTVLSRTHALLRVPSASAPGTTAEGLLV